MANGEPVLFRPEQNFRRLNKSADRIALPELDEEFALAALKKLISIDKDWIPKSEGTSLYVLSLIHIFCHFTPPSSQIYYLIR